MITSVLKKAEKFEIQTYKRPKNREELITNNVSFMGSPYKHPHDKDKVILIADPYSSQTFYYEFQVSDIVFVEELPSITNIEGDTIIMVRVWISKGSIGIRFTPFLVEDTLKSDISKK